jgi:hypothetical protein
MIDFPDWETAIAREEAHHNPEPEPMTLVAPDRLRLPEFRSSDLLVRNRSYSLVCFDD